MTQKKASEMFGRCAIVCGGLILTGCSSTSDRTAAPPPVPAVLAPAPPSAPPDLSANLTAAAAKPALPFEREGWEPMFDGRSLAGWHETPFAGRGEVKCQAGLLVLNMGDPFTGVNFTNEFPRMNYEIALDAMRLMGSDFFCGLTVPVGKSCCSLIVGGWGGSLVGISSLDGMDASENGTTQFINFQTGRWYRIRLRVTEGRIEGWIDKEKLVDVITKDRKITTRPGDIELSEPIGLAAWQTSAAYREIRLRRVSSPADRAKEME